MSDSTAQRPAAASIDRPRSWVWILVVTALLIAASHLLDHQVWSSLRDPGVNDRDWGRLLRSLGYLPTWIIIALAMWLHDRPVARPRRSRALFMLAAPVIGGICAELLKLLVRRLRPDPDVFTYAFRAFSDHPLSNRGMGMPSSHVFVAFAGATALSRLYPRARVLWYLLAAGCALTRVMSVAHYLSDVVAAACGGWIVGEWLWRRLRAVEGAEGAREAS